MKTQSSQYAKHNPSD